MKLRSLLQKLGAIQKQLIVSALKSHIEIISLHSGLHIVWNNLDFENFVHDDCDGLHREDKPYMTVISAYAAYGYHLRRTTSVTSAYKKQFE